MSTYYHYMSEEKWRLIQERRCLMPMGRNQLLWVTSSPEFEAGWYTSCQSLDRGVVRITVPEAATFDPVNHFQAVCDVFTEQCDELGFRSFGPFLTGILMALPKSYCNLCPGHRVIDRPLPASEWIGVETWDGNTWEPIPTATLRETTEDTHV